MHYRFFAILDPKQHGMEQPEDVTSSAVRSTVQNILEQDTTFCGDGGRFGSALADWFVIGGRWSGALQNIEESEEGNDKWTKELHILLHGACKVVHPDNPIATQCYGFTDKDIKENALAFQQAWEKHGGKGKNPYARDTYNNNGYEDDAMLITQEIYDNFLKEHEGSDTDSETYCDLDYDAIDKSIIGKKWIVVVDYHN